MVEVKNLTKCYGDIKAVDDISFTAQTGEILGFLGPNGAGKSTTMNIITGYLSSTDGTVTIDGSEILDEPIKTKAKIGYLPEIPPLYPDMTVIKYLEFMFDLKKVKLPKAEHIKEVMEIVKIDGVKDRIIKNLSKGYKQRVGFAQALLGNPPVLILDEPTVGLDPKQVVEIRTLIKSLGKKHTVIFSSHVLSEVSATCDRIVVISNGKIVADAPTKDLANVISGQGELLLEAEGSQNEISEILNNVYGVKKVRTVGLNTYKIEYDSDTDIRKSVFRAMAKADCPILMMKNGGMSLEESFLKLTENSTRKGGNN
ncbi:MAG: ATP-binding cassette domain-containing protein [Oscillospiraceae bacterium]|nr:ATP-binding cassette domain-containing protein [Candidatus Ruminococcus equi]